MVIFIRNLELTQLEVIQLEGIQIPLCQQMSARKEIKIKALFASHIHVQSMSYRKWTLACGFLGKVKIYYNYANGGVCTYMIYR